jgi:hypothetical protein
MFRLPLGHLSHLLHPDFLRLFSLGRRIPALEPEGDKNQSHKHEALQDDRVPY